MRWLVHVVRIGERRHACKILVGKPEGKRPVGRSSHRWEDNIKTDLQEIRGGVDWDDLAQDRDKWRAVVNAVMKLGFHKMLRVFGQSE
jgi:hypothetical protein